MSDLQDALNKVRYPTATQKYPVVAGEPLAVIANAAKRVANPDYKAATVKLANSEKLRPLAHIALTELPELYKAIAKDVVAAALGLDPPEVTDA